MPSITVAASSGVSDSTIGTVAWNRPERVNSDDGLKADAENTTAGSKVSQYLRAAPGSLAAIPTNATIDGIEVLAQRSAKSNFDVVTDNSVRLRKNGVYLGNNKAVGGLWPFVEDQQTYGGPTDLWGTTWTRNDIVNGLAFGISANLTNLDDEARLDYIEFTIHYTVPVPKAIQISRDADWTGSGSMVADHPIRISENIDWTGSGSLVVRKDLEASVDVDWSDSGTIAGGLRPIRSLLDADWSGSGSLAGFIKLLSSDLNVNWSGSGSLDSIKRTISSINTNWDSQGSMTFDYNFKWSIEHLEASSTHGFSSVYVDVSNTAQPTGSFPSTDVYDRKLVEIPRLQEVNLNSRSGVSGFQRVTLQVDNSDGIVNSINLQDAYVRMRFVDESGNDYKEFNGKVVDWTLSHVVTINVEDIDALAFTEDLPKRTLNDLVEAEKIVDAGFENEVVADDLGKPIPIIFGRAVKVPLLYVKADETNREYDYIIGEGVGLNSNNFDKVFTAYREDRALDSIEGTMTAATSTNLTIESADRKPDQWYQYWWVEMLTGNAAGQITDVTSYDSETNQLTVSAWGVTPTSGTYRLREWRFYPGSQASPYAGYAFIRFKKRLGTANSTDDLYADVNGLQDEVNRVRAIESLLTNSDWGLGLTVDSTSFDVAADLMWDTGMMQGISEFTCEGAILSETSATDIFSKLLSFRDMVLSKEGQINISIDDSKTSGFNFGLGDDTGYNNILDTSPSVSYIHPNEKTKDLKVRYRKNHKENNAYLQEFTRPSSSNGVDDTLDLPFVYDHETADRTLDYKRKRLQAADRTLSLSVGEDGKKAKRGDRVSVDVPTIGLVSSDWEVVGSNVTIAGSNNLDLVPYSATPYTYEQFPDLPSDASGDIDEPFDIPPDFSTTNPDPVSNLVVSMELDTVGVTPIPYADLTWDAPEDNYGGAIVSFRINGSGDLGWRDTGTFDTSAQVQNGLVPGLRYDFRVVALNVTGELKSIALTPNHIKENLLAGGDTTGPVAPTNLTGSSKFGNLIWTWTNSTSTDVLYHEIRIYTASSGGAPVASKKFYQDDVPRFEMQAQTGTLNTSTVTRYAEVQAFDYSGNAGSIEGQAPNRVSASTGDIERDDMEDEATSIVDIASDRDELPGVSQSSGTWYDVLSGQVTLDRTAPIKIRYNGQWVDSGSGFELRLLLGTSTVLKDFSYGGNTVNETDVTLEHSLSLGSGTHTFKIQTRNTLFGGTGLGLVENSLSVEGVFK